MPDILIYQTSDPEFAERAVQVLSDAGISCYRRGRGTSVLRATIGRWADSQIFIYLHDEADSRRANQILIGIGAAVSRPVTLPKGWMIFIFIVVVIISFFILVNGRG